METNKKISILLAVIAITVIMFGIWLKTYNDRIANMQLNETGSCYLDDGTCLHATSDLMMYVAFGIAIFLIILAVYFYVRKKDAPVIIKKIERVVEKPRKQEVQEAPKTLSPESKKIFEIVAESGGNILQGELVAKSGLDKVKVSRILDKLEMHGLIERRRHGMSNLVVLKKK